MTGNIGATTTTTATTAIIAIIAIILVNMGYCDIFTCNSTATTITFIAADIACDCDCNRYVVADDKTATTATVATRPISLDIVTGDNITALPLLPLFPSTSPVMLQPPRPPAPLPSFLFPSASPVTMSFVF